MPGSLRVALTLEQCWHRVPGGTASSILGLARTLQQRPDLDLIGVSAWHRAQAPNPWRPTIPVRRLPVPGTLLYDAWHHLRRPSVERATGPIDVIHATTLAVPPPSAPIVVTIHDLAFLDHPEFFTVRGLRFFRRGLELARRDAAVVVCPSEATRRDCLTNGFDADRVVVVPWGVDASVVTEDDVARVRRRHRLPRPFVLFVGTIEPRKNLRRLLEAFVAAVADGADVDLAIAGPDGWNEELAELVAQTDADESVRDRIRALGFVTGTDLAALYSASTVFCYPSLQEGFGLPVLEAMAQGTPVITSKGTSTEEVAGPAALLVDPNSVESISSAIAQAVAGGPVIDELRRLGPVRAAEFGWDKAAAKMEAVYRRAVA